jgi:hypothetical protein
MRLHFSCYGTGTIFNQEKVFFEDHERKISGNEQAEVFSMNCIRPAVKSITQDGNCLRGNQQALHDIESVRICGKPLPYLQQY